MFTSATYHEAARDPGDKKSFCVLWLPPSGKVAVLDNVLVAACLAADLNTAVKRVLDHYVWQEGVKIDQGIKL